MEGHGEIRDMSKQCCVSREQLRAFARRSRIVTIPIP